MCCCQNFVAEKNNAITILIKKNCFEIWIVTLKKWAGSCLQPFHFMEVMDLQYAEWEKEASFKVFQHLTVAVDQTGWDFYIRYEGPGFKSSSVPIILM